MVKKETDIVLQVTQYDNFEAQVMKLLHVMGIDYQLQDRLTSAQTNAFLNIWDQINHESREFLAYLLRMHVQYCGN